MYYDKEGMEISTLTWGALTDLKNYVSVKVDTIDEYTISTIWKGLSLEELFETAILCEDKNNPMCCLTTSSVNIEEALDCHSVAIGFCMGSSSTEEHDDESYDLSEKIDENFDMQNEVNEIVKERIDNLENALKKLEYNISLLCVAVNRPK